MFNIGVRKMSQIVVLKIFTVVGTWHVIRVCNRGFRTTEDSEPNFPGIEEPGEKDLKNMTSEPDS